MGVDIDLIYEKICEKWNMLRFKRHEDKGGILQLESMAHLEGVDDDICINTIVADTIFAVDFVFDYLNATLVEYNLINEFNMRNLMYKAYIREDGFFVLSYHAPVIDPDQVVQEFTYAMLGLTQEEVRKYLIPIANLTFKEE